MRRLAQFDVGSRFETAGARLGARLVFGGACCALMIGSRGLFDMWFFTSGPFALVYPTVLLATLYGHWQAGTVAYLACFFWAWYFILPPESAFVFEVATDPSRVLLNGVCVLVVLIFAETFRAAAERYRLEAEAEIERRATLLAEMEHRTKNNFAMVASLLEIQRRREGNAEVQSAFDDAIRRVRSFADAYSHLATQQGEGAHVEMRPFLENLVSRVSAAAFTQRVAVERQVDEITLPRETAVAIGLFVNEAMTNCAKYAFPDERSGRVRVSFSRDGKGWRLAVDDDGVGKAAGPARRQGRPGHQPAGGIRKASPGKPSRRTHRRGLPAGTERLTRTAKRFAVSYFSSGSTSLANSSSISQPTLGSSPEIRGTSAKCFLCLAQATASCGVRTLI